MSDALAWDGTNPIVRSETVASTNEFGVTASDAMAADALVAGVRTGSEQAWRVLYHQMGERVHRLCFRMTGDPEMAADLTHDTFLRVFEKGSQYRGNGSLHGWVYRIASNLTKERLRRRKFRTEKAAEALGGPEGADDPVQSQTESRIALEEAMERLPDDFRIAVLLYDVDGYTHQEIAEMLEIAVGTSKARVSRARAQLRDLLKHSL